MAPVKITGKAKSGDTGTKITFLPDGQIFKNRVFKFETLAERLRELAFLNSQVTLTHHGCLRSKTEQDEEFHFKGGLVEFVKYIDDTRPAIIKRPFYASAPTTTRTGAPSRWKWRSQYNDEYSENIFTYVNNINTHEGGTHLDRVSLGADHARSTTTPTRTVS